MRQSSGVLLKEVAAFWRCPSIEVRCTRTTSMTYSGTALIQTLIRTHKSSSCCQKFSSEYDTTVHTCAVLQQTKQGLETSLCVEQKIALRVFFLTRLYHVIAKYPIAYLQ